MLRRAVCGHDPLRDGGEVTSFWPHHSDDEVEAVTRVLRSGATNYWTGDEGVSFEQEFSLYVGARHALTVSNGTTALEMALHALRLPVGSEVILPARTFIACASAVANVGCLPILADIDTGTLNVTVETLEARVTDKSRAVIVVHYAGLPCDMSAIAAWAWERNLYVIEDCAHAHGARIDGRHIGTFGDIGCFSFCVGKIMSTGGEGGAVVTDSTVLANRMAARRDFGRYQMIGSRDAQDLSTFQYTVKDWGGNCRMTEMQSAIARCQLKKLDGWVARRREIAAMYDEELDQMNVRPGHVFYLYLMRVTDWRREGLLKSLTDVGVRYGGCANIGREPVFDGSQYPCPNANDIGTRLIGLPVYPTMTDEDVANVILRVQGALRA